MLPVTISAFAQVTKEHYNLLLEADPSRKLVDGYLQRSFCFEARFQDQLVGVLILLPRQPDRLEIVNLCVNENFRQRQVAQQMISFALEFAQQGHFVKLDVSTGSTSIEQLYLYQKCGFRMQSIDKDYFTRHYPEEIFENGLLLRDRVCFSQEILCLDG